MVNHAGVTKLRQIWKNSNSASSPLATFSPGYFAMVMATGIVSLAAHLQHLNWLALSLFCLNIPAFLVLWVITFLRFVRFRREFIADLTDHLRGVTFLTKVAATSILGSQFAVLTPWTWLAVGLWLFAAAFWIVLSYGFLTMVIVREPKPPLEAGIDGRWLLIVVATQSISVLGALLAPSVPWKHTDLFIALSMYLLGAMLYLVTITLIVYRWIFRTVEAAKLSPSYWINMGALAITTLAGAQLLLAEDYSSLLRELRPFLIGCTLLFLVTATWWIPLLLVMGAWRHLWKRVPLKYDPSYWSLVFPLGMYSAATSMFAQANHETVLNLVPTGFLYIALFAWILTFAGMACRISRTIFGSSFLP